MSNPFVENPEQCVPRGEPISIEELRRRNLGKWKPSDTNELLPSNCWELEGETLSLVYLDSVIHVKVLPQGKFEILRFMGHCYDPEIEYLVIHPRQ